MGYQADFSWSWQHKHALIRFRTSRTHHDVCRAELAQDLCLRLAAHHVHERQARKGAAGKADTQQ